MRWGILIYAKPCKEYGMDKSLGTAVLFAFIGKLKTFFFNFLISNAIPLQMKLTSWMWHKVISVDLSTTLKC